MKQTDLRAYEAGGFPSLHFRSDERSKDKSRKQNFSTFDRSENLGGRGCERSEVDLDKAFPTLPGTNARTTSRIKTTAKEGSEQILKPYSLRSQVSLRLARTDSILNSFQPYFLK